MIRQAVWACRMVKDDAGNYTISPWPSACDSCPANDSEDDARFFGCGLRGFEGQALAPYAHGAKTEPYSKTCPRFYSQNEDVERVIIDLRDYRRAAMGNVLDLGDAHLTYLRIAESEVREWEGTQRHGEVQDSD